MIYPQALAALAALVLAATGHAQVPAPAGPPGFSVTGQPTEYAVAGISYVVDGYRSAKWGMTPAQVRAAIARDFSTATIQPEAIDSTNRTTTIVANLAGLAPGPGPMAITYIFGTASGRLFHVNLDWSYEQPTAADRETLTKAGSAVVADFLSYYWKLMSVARGVALGPNALVLFAASGEAGGGVDVRLQGIGYVLKTHDGQEVTMPPPPDGTQALLHVSFAQSVGKPDVYTIKPGDF